MLDNVVVGAFMVVTVLAFGAVIRRVLGVQVGAVRTLLAAVFALLVAGPVMKALAPDLDRESSGTQLVLVVLAACAATLLAMVAVVVAEVILPTGSLPGPVELWRSWRSRAMRLRRYAEIMRIAVRHGLGRFLRGRRHLAVAASDERRLLARSLREALDDAGVTFVKLGQQLAARRDLVPAEFADELSALQDHAAAVPWSQLEPVLVEELGGPVETVFEAVEPVPLAAASVAQVHVARLQGGAEVVVKVQRPGVRDVVARDVDIVRRLATTIEQRTAWGRSMGAVALADGFAQALHEELDFTVERDNLAAVGAVVEADPSLDVRMPRAVPGCTTARVLVMERLGGVPLNAAEGVLASWGPAARTELAVGLLSAVLDQVLLHGVFHVDLHPGNVLVQPDRRLALLDFGSVGRIDATTRAALARLLAAIGRGDSAASGDALLELVRRPDEVDERELERAVGELIVRHAVPGVRAGAAAFTALFRLVTAHRLAIPASVAAVFRAFATLEATLLVVDPGFDLVGETRSLGETRLRTAFAPPQLRRAAEGELAAVLPLLRRLPRRIDRIADGVEHGRTTLRVRLLAHPDDQAVVAGLVHQALLTVLTAGAGLMAVVLVTSAGGPQVTEAVSLFALLGYGLLVVSVVLALRVLAVVLRRGPP